MKMQAVIVYYSLTGRTSQAAKYISKGLEEANVVVTRVKVHSAKIDDLANKDIVVIGTPVHLSAPAIEIRRFLNKLPEKALDKKKISFFATYFLSGHEPALSTMEEIARDKGATKIIPGLARRSSVLRELWNMVTGSTEDEEAWVAFGKLIATS
jgi:flavodoxin